MAELYGKQKIVSQDKFKNLIYVFMALLLVVSCNGGSNYKSAESNDSLTQEDFPNIEPGQTSDAEDNLMVTCPICMGNGEGVFFDTYQICPVCKGDKIIPQKWIDEANRQSSSIESFDGSNEEASDGQKQYIESEISRLESVIQMAESGMENCSSDILILQYKNQITEAQYEIRRLKSLLNEY